LSSCETIIADTQWPGNIPIATGTEQRRSRGQPPSHLLRPVQSIL
jgi:hypothetical protein